MAVSSVSPWLQRNRSLRTRGRPRLGAWAHQLQEERCASFCPGALRWSILHFLALEKVATKRKRVCRRAQGAAPEPPDGDDDLKVGELVELLKDQDPDAKVFVMIQDG